MRLYSALLVASAAVWTCIESNGVYGPAPTDAIYPASARADEKHETAATERRLKAISTANDESRSIPGEVGGELSTEIESVIRKKIESVLCPNIGGLFKRKFFYNRESPIPWFTEHEQTRTGTIFPGLRKRFKQNDFHPIWASESEFYNTLIAQVKPPAPKAKLLAEYVDKYGDDVVARKIGQLEVEGTPYQKLFAERMRVLLVGRWWKEKNTVSKVIKSLNLRTDRFVAEDVAEMKVLESYIDHINGQVAKVDPLNKRLRRYTLIEMLAEDLGDATLSNILATSISTTELPKAKELLEQLMHDWMDRGLSSGHVAAMLDLQDLLMLQDLVNTLRASVANRRKRRMFRYVCYKNLKRRLDNDMIVHELDMKTYMMYKLDIGRHDGTKAIEGALDEEYESVSGRYGKRQKATA